TPEGAFLKENTVFLIATAILKNFFLHLLDVIGGRVKGLDRTARLKRFLRMFVVVPAKWIKSGRRNVLNLYTKRRIFLELVR
ncbi:MAG: IS1380 family transposase, partial [Anaerovoracaceae bacterium]